MTVTKTSSNTYNLKVYIPKEIRSKMGIKGSHFVKRYKTRKEAREAELDILTKIHQLENGENLLAPYFPEIQMRRYEDAIEIAEAEPLISYILSCHGNQNQLLLNQYKEFREFVSARVADGFHITKDAGIFLCRK